MSGWAEMTKEPGLVKGFLLWRGRGTSGWQESQSVAVSCVLMAVTVRIEGCWCKYTMPAPLHTWLMLQRRAELPKA